MFKAIALLCCLATVGQYAVTVSAEGHVSAGTPAEEGHSDDDYFTAGCPDLSKPEAQSKLGCIWAAKTCVDCPMQCLANTIPVQKALEKSTKLVGYQHAVECYEESMAMKMLLKMGSMRRRSLLSETDDVVGAVSEALSSSETVSYGLSLSRHVANMVPYVAHTFSYTVAQDAAKLRDRVLEGHVKPEMTAAEKEALMGCLTTDEVKTLTEMMTEESKGDASMSAAEKAAAKEMHTEMMAQLNRIAGMCATQTLTTAQASEMNAYYMAIMSAMGDKADKDMFAAGKICLPTKWDFKSVVAVTAAAKDGAKVCMTAKDETCLEEYLRPVSEACASIMAQVEGVDSTTAKELAMNMAEMDATCGKRTDEATCIASVSTEKLTESMAAAANGEVSSSVRFGLSAGVVLAASVAAILM